MDVQQVQLQPRYVLGLQEVVALDQLPDFFGRAFSAAAAGLGRQGVVPSSPPVALYRGPATDKVDVLAGFPVHAGMQPDAGLTVAELPGGPAVVTVHTGPYDALATTYGELTRWMSERGLAPREEMWEEYLVGPDSEPDPARWQTRIVFPVA